MTYECEQCGWEWPLAKPPRIYQECDNCGGALMRSPTADAQSASDTNNNTERSEQ